ncbi:MAG: DUF1566 domain-containing protein [Candidatus Lernaella stagnicola]|nr:DUF1566 domain-containing protein [Candidatus Lernaella stagnicola]
MRKLYFLVLLAVLFLGLGLLLSCGDDDDDDDSGGSDDDDAGGDLTWQDPPSSDYMTWENAKIYCANLSFDGHDDWRLPTISELRSLIRGCPATELGGSCGVTDGCTNVSDCWNDACSGCDYLEGPGSGGAYWPDGMSGGIAWYWSSSPVADLGDGAFGVDFYDGYVEGSYIGFDDHARCVR